MQKRALLYFMVLVIIAAPAFTESTVKHYKIDFDYHNPESTEYDGGRGPNQLIVYSSEFGDRTGTNEWGIEVVVEDGRVVSVGGNDNIIPENGYVLSAHGAARVYLSALARENRKIEIDFDRNIVHISYDQLERLDNYRQELDKLQRYREQVEDEYSWLERRRQRRYESRILSKINNMKRDLRNNPQVPLGSDFIELENMLKEAWQEIKSHN